MPQVRALSPRPKNPSLRAWIFLFKPIGLVYHHALACISLPHLCGVYHHTIGVHISIGLMRYSSFATDDIQGFALILKPSIYTFFHILLSAFINSKKFIKYNYINPLSRLLLPYKSSNPGSNAFATNDTKSVSFDKQ